ncbi:hypothetical protein CUJ83_15330 [Methanocella sp. CWC-04]|uniref:GxxExxY protein n=1 Tax=Methanooceanicella nereidis TaxID=2052831 RepID=A0AAP2W7F4_9EURY|nr:GxxExxY protein [Methanocella sp. CWC-04]MCD1296368.1 hypothetical protein [Methanocella sp. CWC-04]
MKAIEPLADKVIESAGEVHKELGSELLIEVYEKPLKKEMKKRGLSVVQKAWFPARYEDVVMEKAFFVDFFVDGTLLVKIKSDGPTTNLDIAILRSYLKHAGKSMGLLLNFYYEDFNDCFKKVMVY